MTNLSSAKGKGKAKVVIIDLTDDAPSSSEEAVQAQLHLPTSPPHGARPIHSTQAGGSRAVPSSFTTNARPGPSSTPLSSTLSPTQGTKRKAQATITSFFPAKKPRIDVIPTQPTPNEKKVLRGAEKVAREEQKLVRAEARRLVMELEKEEREARKEKANAAKAAKAEERRLKKETRDAEVARKREVAQWRVDWKEWVQRTRQPNAVFQIPKDENRWQNHMNANGAKELDLTRHELDCLPHCEVKNPADEDYPPMKLYRIVDVQILAFWKEGIVNGISQDDEEALLREGERRLNLRKKKKDVEQVG
jgi:hypothetical protein